MSILKGWFGEKMTTFNMWLSLNGSIYRRFHDVIVPSKNGTTQIDHLIVSRYGVFIVETKNMRGWIFGSEHQQKWIQSLFKEKYPFQNPIKQTYRQKKVLAEFLNVQESVIRTVIYFVGDSTFKTRMPNNVIDSGLGTYIKQFNNQVLSTMELDRLLKVIERHKVESPLSKRDHKRSLQQRHNSDSICPKCGSELILRTVKNGSNTVSKFLGCKSYPKCKFTKNV
jgi:restriction system protein